MADGVAVGNIFASPSHIRFYLTDGALYMYDNIADDLEARNIKIFRSFVGENVTSLEMRMLLNDPEVG